MIKLGRAVFFHPQVKFRTEHPVNLYGALLEMKYYPSNNKYYAVVEWNNSFLELREIIRQFTDCPVWDDMKFVEAPDEAIITTQIPPQYLIETGKYVDPETVWHLSSTYRRLIDKQNIERYRQYGGNQIILTQPVYNQEVHDTLSSFPRMKLLDNDKIDKNFSIFLSVNQPRDIFDNE